MLWYKFWLDTRWRFLIGLVLMAGSAFTIALAYPRVMQLMPLLPPADTGGELGRRIREVALLSREFRGYVWAQWFRQQPTQLGTLFAVLLGTGGLVSPAGGGALFTLSLPVSRERLVATRAAAGLVELLAIAIVSSLVFPMVAPAVGQSYGIGSALVHAVCWFAGGAVFFSLALLFSTVFGDVWRPLLLACAVAFALAMVDFVFRDLAPYSIFRVISAERYFRTGSLPWLGLIASAAISAGVVYAAARNFARRDF
jgi:ABC-2 type transport system permease protein